MLRPRWIKLLRDIWTARGRMALMTAAIATSLFAVGAILSTYTILTREISRNYLGTIPASATLELDKTAESVVELIRAQPGIERAEARASILSRIQIQPGVWQPLLLFVIKDFNAMNLATFRPEAGAWPPPEGTILLERTVPSVFGIKQGDSVSN